MKSKYDYDIIRDYLHGLVDQETAQRIREQIEQDEIARGIAEGIVHLDHEFNGKDEDIDSYLENFGERQLGTIRGTIQGGQNIKMFWVRMAATFLLLLAASAVVWFTMSGPDLNSVVDRELSQPYPVSTIVRGQVNESDRQHAFDLYAKGEYAKASGYFDLAMRDPGEPASVTFYNGLSQLYAREYSKAIKLLESDVVSESRYAEQARWYLSLALIKSDDNPGAIRMLLLIKNDSRHFRHEEALQLLDRME